LGFRACPVAASGLSPFASQMNVIHDATSALGLGHIPLVLSEAAPALKALFQGAVVWDGFIAAVARLQSKAA
jgi:hypothetical protein